MKTTKKLDLTDVSTSNHEKFLKIITDTTQENIAKWLSIGENKNEQEWIDNPITFRWEDIGRVFFDIEIIKWENNNYMINKLWKKELIKPKDFFVSEDIYTYFDWENFNVYNKITGEELGSW